MPSSNVNPDQILRELRELWVGLGKSQEVPGGVLRACSMTLLAVTDSASANASVSHSAVASPSEVDDTESVHRMIGLLMHDHPSRAIVLAPRDGADLNARVFSECWMPYHSRQQICAEGVEITADAEEMDEVVRLLMALVVPDLPVVLWCRGPRAFRDRTLDPLFPLAHKIVFDTGAARHAPTAVEFLRRLQKDGRTVADLAWTRLTGWRETIAALFDEGLFDDGQPDKGRCDLSRFASVRVLHDGRRPGSGAMYLARWIDRSCDGVSVHMEQAVVNDAGAPAAQDGLRGVVFTGPTGEISIQRVGGSLEIRSPHRAYTSPLPPALDESVMREELSLLDRDPVFEEILK